MQRLSGTARRQRETETGDFNSSRTTSFVSLSSIALGGTGIDSYSMIRSTRWYAERLSLGGPAWLRSEESGERSRNAACSVMARMVRTPTLSMSATCSLRSR